jgi:hypothetical protein
MSNRMKRVRLGALVGLFGLAACAPIHQPGQWSIGPLSQARYSMCPMWYEMGITGASLPLFAQVGALRQQVNQIAAKFSLVASDVRVRQAQRMQVVEYGC